MYTAKLKIHQIQTLRNQNQTMRLHLILILLDTSYSALLFRICVHHFFDRAFLSLLNLVISLQRRLVRSPVALQLFVVSPARHHRLVSAAVLQLVCLHHRLERVCFSCWSWLSLVIDLYCLWCFSCWSWLSHLVISFSDQISQRCLNHFLKTSPCFYI